MASDQTEMTLYDFLIDLSNRGLFRFSPNSQFIPYPDQDSSQRSDPPEMTQVTPDDQLNDSRTTDLSQNTPIATDSADSQTDTDPDQDSSERSDPRDRIILMNPLTRRVVVIEGSASRIEALVRSLTGPAGPPPASKASIEAMQSVEAKEDDECVICMDEFVSGLAKEMPCKHKFHGDCVEKWLKINGSCPVCRYKMPEEDENDINHKNVFEGEEVRRRGSWVTISVGTLRVEPNQMVTQDSDGQEQDSEMQAID